MIKKIFNNEKCITISKVFRENKNYPIDVLEQIFQYLSSVYGEFDFINRINSAYIASKYMTVDCEDIICLLLAYPMKSKIISTDNLLQLFPHGEINISSIEKYIVNAFKNPNWKTNFEKQNNIVTEEIYLEHYIMCKICEKHTGIMINEMLLQGYSGTDAIYQAFNLAYKAYEWLKSDTGEPYINYPIQVAKILFDADVDSTVISATFLYYLVRSGEYTIKYVREKFGRKVAEYIDVAISVGVEKEISSVSIGYNKEEPKNVVQNIDEFINIINDKPGMIYSLFIKAADRIQNLKTSIGISESIRKQMIDETEQEYIPILNRYNLYYFSNCIDEIIWNIQNPELYKDIDDKYSKLIRFNSDSINETFELLDKVFRIDFNQLCEQSFISGYKTNYSLMSYTPYKIYLMIKNMFPERNSIIEYVSKTTIPIYDFFLVLEPLGNDCSIKEFTTLFVKIFNKKIEPSRRAIIDIYIDNFNELIVLVEDRYRNKIRYRFILHNDYMRSMFGNTHSGTNKEVYDDVPPDTDMIYVHLKDGRIKKMAKGSKVIDLAFEIHEHIGLSAKGAMVNGNPSSLFSVLHNGDTVIIDAETHEDEETLMRVFNPNCRIEWLYQATTDKARRKIYKYLERIYEG